MATQAPTARSGGMSFTILGAVLAVVGFGVVFLLGSLQGGGSKAPAAAATVPVLVAADNISFRQALTAKDVTVVKYAPADVPPAVLTKPDQVASLVAAVNIAKGQAITSNLLVHQGDQITSPAPAYLPIPSGYVAYTIPTGEMQGVAGFIQAGDYISVIATVAVKGIATTTSRTIFTNVHVLAVGPSSGTVEPAPSPGASSSQTPAKTGGVSSSLTVVVTQCQAEYLNWFLANESLKYTLESYKDYQPQASQPDPSCPSVTSARGVTENDVKARYPGLTG